MELIADYNHYNARRALPLAGGMLDQTAIFFEAVSFLDAETEKVATALRTIRGAGNGN